MVTKVGSVVQDGQDDVPDVVQATKTVQNGTMTTNAVQEGWYGN